MANAPSTNAILSLDQGTTSSRAIIFDQHANLLSTAQQEFTQYFPQPGWVEHDANEIWQSQLHVARQAISQLPAFNIVAIGITNQRETTVVWNRRTGEPIAPAIVWQDRRTAPYCETLLAANHSALIQAKTGLLIDAYFSATKLKWLLDNTEGARAGAAAGDLAFGTIDSWLTYKLTGGKVHATDVSNASRTMLFDIHALDWDHDLLRLFDIPRSVLPKIVSSSEVVGVTDCEGLPPGIPIAGIAGDQQAALFGQACYELGMAKNTYGTGCFMLMNTGEKAVASMNRLLTTVAWRVNGITHYALEGSVFMGGASVQWLRDGLGIIAQSGDVEALAAEVADSAGVMMVPAFTGLGAPYWDSGARGTITGLTRGSNRSHIARATLEAIAYQSADLLAAMHADARIALRELRVDGGASNNNLLMQFQADILQTAVVRPRVTETTALGAAYLAGLAVGFWRDQAEIASLWTRERTFEPLMPADDVARRMTNWARAVEAARRAGIAA